MPSPGEAHGDSQLSHTAHIPIAQLTPLLSSPASRSIKAIVTLLWPYSASKRTLTLLLSEPDFRLRLNHGQVRVQFVGPAAKAVVESATSIGDEVVLSLEGVEFIRDEIPMSTPGKGVDCELKFSERLLLQINPRLGQSSIVDIDHPPPSPTKQPDSSDDFLQSTPPPPIVGLSPSNSSPSLQRNQWTSPAFLKRAKVHNTLLKPAPYDPFALDDGYVEGKGRKRARFSIESGSWKYQERSPSPEKDPATDPIVTDEQDLGSSPPVLIKSAGDFSPQPTEPSVIPTQESQRAVITEDSAKMPPPGTAFGKPHGTQKVGSPNATPATIDTQTPLAPRLQPIPSPTLPMVSPLPQSQEKTTYFSVDHGQNTSMPNMFQKVTGDHGADMFSLTQEGDENGEVEIQGAAPLSDEPQLGLEEQLLNEASSPTENITEEASGRSVGMINFADQFHPVGEPIEQVKHRQQPVERGNGQFESPNDPGIGQEIEHQRILQAENGDYARKDVYGEQESSSETSEEAAGEAANEDIEQEMDEEQKHHDEQDALASEDEDYDHGAHFQPGGNHKLSEYHDSLPRHQGDSPTNSSSSVFEHDVDSGSDHVGFIPDQSAPAREPKYFISEQEDSGSDATSALTESEGDSSDQDVDEREGTEAEDNAGDSDSDSDIIITGSITHPMPPTKYASQAMLDEDMEADLSPRSSSSNSEADNNEPPETGLRVEEAEQSTTQIETSTYVITDKSTEIRYPSLPTPQVSQGVQVGNAQHSADMGSLLERSPTQLEGTVHSPASRIEPPISDEPASPQSGGTAEPVPQAELDKSSAEKVERFPRSTTSPVPVSLTPDPSFAQGFRTAHSYFASLAQLSSYHQSTIDTIAIVHSTTRIYHATSGPKDYHVTLHLAEPSSFPALTNVQIFRPYKEALPSAEPGKIILLRNFKVVSAQRKLELLSTGESAWVLWNAEGEGGGSPLDVQITGPPVEYGAEEEDRVRALLNWWHGYKSSEEGSSDEEESELEEVEEAAENSSDDAAGEEI
ncbi:MAG: hypothetical protein M4579_003050 [Chaenotheca gracillima]|nr:MAG: hypothetical protein M4579_003050 [Chaenotheca gracillima]